MNECIAVSFMMMTYVWLQEDLEKALIKASREMRSNPALRASMNIQVLKCYLFSANACKASIRLINAMFALGWKLRRCAEEARG
jgi:hypothetical protein